MVELRREFGHGFNVWIQPVGEGQKAELSTSRIVEWSVASNAAKDDLVIFYYTNPDKAIKDVFRVVGPVEKYKRAEWSGRADYMAQIRLVCRLKAPLFLDHLRRHHILKTSGFVRGSMRGRPRATEFWPDLYDEIVRRNPRLKARLKAFAPESL